MISRAEFFALADAITAALAVAEADAIASSDGYRCSIVILDLTQLATIIAVGSDAEQLSIAALLIPFGIHDHRCVAGVNAAERRVSVRTARPRPSATPSADSEHLNVRSVVIVPKIIIPLGILFAIAVAISRTFVLAEPYPESSSDNDR